MTELQAPIGYRFKPSDEVIIQYYLIPKIEGKPLPSKHIYETGEIYGKESHDLENTFQQGKEWYKQFASYDENSDDSLYFFTKLTKKWDNGSRISRTAGDGTWTANNAGRPIYTDVSYTVKYRTYSFTDNSVTGHKRKKETVASDGNTFTWNMDEYSILKGEQKLDYAIVKIRRKRSNNGGSTSSSSKQASSSSKKVKSCNYEVINDALACQDGFEVHNTATEGQHYANTSYHPTLDNVAGFQYCQNSSISFGNVVPSPEYNHLQYQPYASPSTTKSSNNTGLPGFWLNNCVFNEQAAAFQGFSSKSVLQDDVLETQQQPQAWGDPMNKNIPNYYQGPPFVYDTCYQYPLPSGCQHETENNMDLSANSLEAAVEPVAADGSIANGGDNASAQDQEGTNDTLMPNSDEAVHPQNNLWGVSDEELMSDLINGSEENLLKLEDIFFPDLRGLF